MEWHCPRAQTANDVIASALPRNCRSLITCFAAGEQFGLNLVRRYFLKLSEEKPIPGGR